MSFANRLRKALPDAEVRQVGQEQFQVRLAAHTMAVSSRAGGGVPPLQGPGRLRDRRRLIAALVEARGDAA